MTETRIDPARVVAPAHPWRRVARTMFAAVSMLAPIMPTIIDAFGVSRTVPIAAGLLAIAAGATRLLAHPQVELFLREHAPWLSASDVAAEDVVAQTVRVDLGTVHYGGGPVAAGEADVVVAGDAHVEPTGTLVRTIDVQAEVKPRPRKRAARRKRRAA